MADFAYVNPTISGNGGGRDFSGNQSSSFNINSFQQDQTFQSELDQSDARLAVVLQKQQHDSLFEQSPNGTQAMASSLLLHQPHTESHSQITPHSYSRQGTNTMSRDASQHSSDHSSYMQRRATQPGNMSPAPSYRQHQITAKPQSLFSQDAFALSKGCSESSREFWTSMAANSQYPTTTDGSYDAFFAMDLHGAYSIDDITRQSGYLRRTSDISDLGARSLDTLSQSSSPYLPNQQASSINYTSNHADYSRTPTFESDHHPESNPCPTLITPNQQSQSDGSNSPPPRPLKSRRRRSILSSDDPNDHNIIIAHVTKSGKFKCSETDCAELTFGRQADFRRHYDNSHGLKKVEYYCPFQGCARSRVPTGGRSKGQSFGQRKDKREEHIRNVHDRRKTIKPRLQSGTEHGTRDDPWRRRANAQSMKSEDLITETWTQRTF